MKEINILSFFFPRCANGNENGRSLLGVSEPGSRIDMQHIINIIISCPIRWYHFVCACVAVWCACVSYIPSENVCYGVALYIPIRQGNLLLFYPFIFWWPTNLSSLPLSSTLTLSLSLCVSLLLVSLHLLLCHSQFRFCFDARDTVSRWRQYPVRQIPMHHLRVLPLAPNVCMLQRFVCAHYPCTQCNISNSNIFFGSVGQVTNPLLNITQIFSHVCLRRWTDGPFVGETHFHLLLLLLLYVACYYLAMSVLFDYRSNYRSMSIQM